jgi:isopentenyl diphosphate isomerase/L-lactate dehydrogenase-like FMN-dependent dehydrogenase
MIADRKDDHVRFALEQQRTLGGYNQFDEVSFVHHALAGIDRSDVCLATRFGGLEWQVPLYINAMTGGSSKTGAINRDLATAAQETPTGSSSRTSTRTPLPRRRSGPSTCCRRTPCRSTSTSSRRP